MQSWYELNWLEIDNLEYFLLADPKHTVYVCLCRKPAEEFLQSVERNQNYPILLLSLINKQDLEPNIKVCFFYK